MFGHRYFGARYFGARYFGPATDGLVDYTLTADQGTYTLSGQAASLRVAYKITAAQGSYALNGQDITFDWNHILAASQGSYSLSGQAALLTVGYKVTGAQGSYTLSGQDITFDWNHVLAAAQGSYTLSGQAASLKPAYKLSAAQGSYTLSGQDAAFRYYHLTAEQGSYTLSGQTVTLTYVSVDAAGGTSKRKARKPLERKLSEEKIKELRERTHKRRRVIWERPTPEVQDAPKRADLLEPENITSAAYVDPLLRAEIDANQALIDLNQIRAERAEDARQAASATALMQALREAEKVTLAAQERDDEEAIFAILMAA